MCEQDTVAHTITDKLDPETKSVYSVLGGCCCCCYLCVQKNMHREIP